MMQDLASYSETLKCHFEQHSSTANKNGLAIATQKYRNLHIGIVGAGLAGLRCAEILIRKGINVTMVEARDRLGGRVSSQGNSNGDFSVDRLHRSINPIYWVDSWTCNYATISSVSFDTWLMDLEGALVGSMEQTITLC